MEHFNEIQDLSYRLKKVEERIEDLQKFDGSAIAQEAEHIGPILTQVGHSYYWLSEARKRYLSDCIRKRIGEQLELELNATKTELSKYEICKKQ